MSRKSSDVIKRAKKMRESGYRYVYGYKGTKITKQGIAGLAKSYPSVFSSYIKNLALAKVGKIGIDCSGFVNEACDTNLGGSTNIKNSFKKCYKVSDTSHVVNGMGIWHQGHIALIEVNADGKAYIHEARSTAKDLTVSSWKGRSGDFVYYGKIPGVDYNGANIYGIGKVRAAKIKGKCYFYKKRDTKAGVIEKFDNGTPVNIVNDMGDGWSKCWYDGKTGYIKNSVLNAIGLSKYKEDKVNHDTYLRNKNNKASKKLMKVKKGTEVKVICKRKYWSNVICNGVNGWVPTKYL